MSIGRHRASERRFPPAAIIAGVVTALAVAAIGLFALRGRGGLPRGDDVSGEIPAFTFSLGRTTAIPTIDADPAQFEAEARTAAQAATDVLTELYVAAFLDPANWRERAYDEAWEAFHPAAQAAALEDVEVLTVGGLGGGFQRIDPARGKVTARVLVDERGHPVTVVALVRFSAEARGKDGTVTALVSSGQFILRRVDGAWRVYSYEVDRTDRKKEPTVGPSATPTDGAP